MFILSITRVLLFFVVFLSCHRLLAEQLCSKEEAYLLEQPRSSYGLSQDCTINSSQLRTLQNVQYFVWGVSSPQLADVISIDQNTIAQIATFSNKTPVLVFPGPYSVPKIASYCSRLLRFHPRVKILVSDDDFLFKNIDVWLTKETAIELMTYENVTLYEKNIKIDSSMTYIVVSDQLLNYKGRLQNDQSMASSMNDVFFVRAFKEEVESHARLLRLAKEKKNTIPDRYRCR